MMGATPIPTPIVGRQNVKAVNHSGYELRRKVCKTFIRRFNSDPRLQQPSFIGSNRSGLTRAIAA